MDENLILEERGSLRILTPKKGYKMYNIKTNEYYKKVYLGKYDSVENYKAIVDEEYVDIDLAVELQETKDRLNVAEQTIKELQTSQVSQTSLMSILEEEVNK